VGVFRGRGRERERGRLLMVVKEEGGWIWGERERRKGEKWSMGLNFE
jgi:hypothetical protein